VRPDEFFFVTSFDDGMMLVRQAIEQNSYGSAAA
jgi:hypothetical protein